MNKSAQLICVHSALLYATVLGVGMFVFTGWLPPLSPTLTGEALRQVFMENTTAIRIGLVIGAVGASIYWPFCAAIYTQMKRIEGEHHPLSTTLIGAASGGVVAVMIPAYIWLAVAYRPESMSLGTMQMLSDFSWFMFIGAFGPAFVQNIALGLCILMDKSGLNIYPRWVAYANLWIAVVFMPGALLPFFKSGPFAWNGLISFWLVAVVFFAWILMMWWVTLQAIHRQAAESSQ